MTTTPRDLAIQPGALLATAPAEATAEQLNEALAPHGLCLPIFPLVAGQTLADLVASNAGGRRLLRYGPIGRYIRAATLEGPDGTPIEVGGPTIKRATGYAVNRAIAGSALNLGVLRELTVSLRPLPATRVARLLRCPSPEVACALAARLMAAGPGVSALALAVEGMGAWLLAEIEGVPGAVARQVAMVEGAAATVGAELAADPKDPWQRWEHLAQAHQAASHALSLTMPRAALASYISRALAIGERYGIPLALWGDAGAGTLRLSTPPGSGAEAAQLLAVLRRLATESGGAPSTEDGPGGIDGREESGGASKLWVEGAAPLPPPTDRSAVMAALRARVGDPWLLTRLEDVATYETDASIARPLGVPLAVALPANTAEVSELLRVAAAYGLPVVARGAGSGLAGGATPSAGALIVSLNRLEQIQIDREQMVAHVGAGAITAEVQRAAEAVGLFYPPDPSSQAASTIGGNIACNAGGPRCVKYGVTADYVLAVTAVLADGRVVRWGDGLTGQGFDNGLAQLLVGSEGTLAIITEATLRLIPLPTARRTTMALFASLEQACATVEQIMAAGIVPAGLEIMDDSCIAAVEAYLKLGLPRDTGAMLLMLADGEPEEVEADSARLAELARAGGAQQVVTAQSAAEEANLWKARRAVSIALTRVRPNRLGEDISVPLPQIAACVRQIKAVAAAHALPIVVFGHAGDGNLHPNILFDARDAAETARLWPAAEGVFAAALAAGGTLSGEHGIGTLKRPFMRQALGAPALALQRQLKARFDPTGRLNPGKVLPD
ncbi:MAG: FAD-linked oxidase C-terminal domain-containing protein [Chloroflexi bacterium OHK40]